MYADAMVAAFKISSHAGSFCTLSTGPVHVADIGVPDIRSPAVRPFAARSQTLFLLTTFMLLGAAKGRYTYGRGKGLERPTP
jgi:hypothetical protein